MTHSKEGALFETQEKSKLSKTIEPRNKMFKTLKMD